MDFFLNKNPRKFVMVIITPPLIVQGNNYSSPYYPWGTKKEPVEMNKGRTACVA